MADYDCAIPSPLDMEELIVKKTISRMLSDNYTLIIVFVVILGILAIIFTYFGKQILNSIKQYKKNNLQNLIGDPDKEIYLEEENNMIDVKKYQEGGKQQFYKDIDKIYREYNVEKTNYIKSTYGSENDDYIDQKISYKTYDNHEYN